MPVRILRLTDSNDFTAEIPPELRAAAIAERAFFEATGCEAETILKRIWPTPGLDEIVARWIEREAPDIIFMRVASYWFTYQSVPLRLERALGGWVKPVTSLGNRAAANRRMGFNRGFKLLQKAALRTIGGATLQTQDETVALVETCLRPMLAREGAGVVIRGPRTPFGGMRSARALRRSEEQRQYVNQQLAALCERHQVTFLAFEGLEGTFDRGTRMADFVHVNEIGHRTVGEMEGAAMAREWARLHA